MEKSLSTIAKAYFIRPLFTAIFAVAMAFTLSCSGDDDGGGGGGSSTLTPCNDGTVTIGTQTWQKCNLNVEPSKGIFRCYGNDSANCAISGKLYNWEAAMSSCPSGFHLPSKEEWEALTTYVQNSKNCKDCDAKHLKAKNGWNNNGNGLDSYGFTAIPGGSTSVEYGRLYGDMSFFWTATEWGEGSPSAYGVYIYPQYDRTYLAGNNDKSTVFFSVRCLQNTGTQPSSSSSYISSSSISIIDGTFTDSRDGKIYKWVNIGTQTWMAENLNLNADGSKCYGEGADVQIDIGNDDYYYASLSNEEIQSNCNKYGRLYDGATAMGVCPAGWHLPSDEDWNTLIKFVNPNCKDNRDCKGGGFKLKATSGWGISSGTDGYGFSALSGGIGVLWDGGGYFLGVSKEGDWWSASEYEYNNKNYVGILKIKYDDVSYNSYEKNHYFLSVRCMQDSEPSSSSSSIGSSSSSIGGGTDPNSCVSGTVTIGSQVWQKCNSDAVTSVGISKCYDNKESNCTIYGRLYNWEAANSVCPSGFHLPTKEEWDALTAYIEGDKDCTKCDAKHLRAHSYWNKSGGDNLDTYGFSALPGGSGYYDGSFSFGGDFGFWWSASEYNNNGYNNNRSAYYWEIFYRYNYSERGDQSVSALYSVRCLKDD